MPTARDMPRAKRREAATGADNSGSAVDRQNPTENVKALHAASLENLAELRAADKELMQAKLSHLKEIGDLRDKHGRLLRKSDLTTAEKTRQVDVLAAAGSAGQLATAVQALQNATDRSTETLRNQVAATAQAMAKQTADSAAAVQAATENLFRRTETAIAAVSDRVGTLERTGSTVAGRSSVADPQMAALVEKMEKFVTAQTMGVGKSEGISASWGVLIGVAGLIAAGIATVVSLRGNGAPAAQTTAPQVIYVPAPQVTPVPQPVTPAR